MVKGVVDTTIQQAVDQAYQPSLFQGRESIIQSTLQKLSMG